MKSQFGSTLFLIGSPFQCLCMLEAIDHFDIVVYDVLILYNDLHSLDKIHILLSEKGIPYQKKKVAHLLYDVVPFILRSHNYYDNIFIGNFYSEQSIALANIYGKFRAKIYYLDDGVQALSYFSSRPRKIKNTFKVRGVIGFYRLIGVFKLIRKPIFFTIFDVKSDTYHIIRNTLSTLISKISAHSEGIYIIGTNSSILEFRDYNYIHYLKALYQYISFRYPNEKIYYCPHRRDTNLHEIYALCDTLNIEVFHTKVSVEIDFINEKVTPKYIFGFTSNALYTLKMLFPAAEIMTVMYHLTSYDADYETQIIRNEMLKSGISTVNIIQDSADGQ